MGYSLPEDLGSNPSSPMPSCVALGQIPHYLQTSLPQLKAGASDPYSWRLGAPWPQSWSPASPGGPDETQAGGHWLRVCSLQKPRVLLKRQAWPRARGNFHVVAFPAPPKPSVQGQPELRPLPSLPPTFMEVSLYILFFFSFRAASAPYAIWKFPG